MNRSKFTQRLVYPFAGLVVTALLTGMAWVVRGREAPQAASTDQTPVPDKNLSKKTRKNKLKKIIIKEKN